MAGGDQRGRGRAGRSDAAGARGGQLRGEGQGGRRADLEAQRRALAAACRRRGWQLPEPLEDTGRSAQDRKRPGSEQALRVLERAEGQALVAAKRERLSQALLDLASLLASAQKQGFALIALDCALETTPAGETIAHLLASFAPCEQRLHAQRIRAGLAQARARGVRLGRPPSIAPYVLERIKREHAAGTSLTTIANGLNADRIPTAQGGRRWYPATIRYTLNRTR